MIEKLELIAREVKESRMKGTLTARKEKEFKMRALNVAFGNIDYPFPIDGKQRVKQNEASIDPSFFVRKKFLSIP